MNDDDDLVRPSRNVFRQVYEKGYRTWAALCHGMVHDTPNVGIKATTRLDSAIPNHPHFPEGLLLDKSFSNVITASGRTTWTTIPPGVECCEFPAFQEETVTEVAWDRPTDVVLTDDPGLGEKCRGFFADGEELHVSVLFLAWAYVLSARWAELIPGANGPTYDKGTIAPSSTPEDSNPPGQSTEPIVVSIGDADEDAARWWASVLSEGSGWEASMLNNRGKILHSPWSTRVVCVTTSFAIASKRRSHSSTSNARHASFEAASRYISEYCRLHSISQQQNEAALTSALLIPLAKFDGRRINLPLPRSQVSPRAPSLQINLVLQPWGEDVQPLERLLTFGSNPRGVKALLSSIFFEPGIDCNTCGAWLQGSFAFLDSDEASQPWKRLQMFMRRDPGLDFLWIGAFITGAEARCLQDARAGWWKVDLGPAAWTGTHVSFIQESVHRASSVVSDRISRADECRVLFLAHEPGHTVAPLFPFPPFGHTAMEDTDLEVRLHAKSSQAHRLGYRCFGWNCEDGRRVVQAGSDKALIRMKACSDPAENEVGRNIEVDYSGLDEEDEDDDEDETSEMVTRNIFEWLRGDAGFPVAERAIRQHPWIDNLESYDEEENVQGGDVRSVPGHSPRIRGWMLGVKTAKCNSL